MKIESVPIESISPDPANVRKHPAKNLDAIRASLRRFGQQKPLVVDGSGVIRAGNGTYAAARELGWTEIAITRTELTGAEAIAYSLSDNRTGDLSEFDNDVSALIESLKVDLPDLPVELSLNDLIVVQPEPVEPPSEFKEFDENIETQYCCPKCNFEWSGKPK